MTIRWRITLWYSGIITLVLFLLGFSLYFFFARWEMSGFDENLKQRSQEVIRSIRIVDSFFFPLQQAVLPDIDIFAAPNTFIQVVNKEGRLIARSASLSRSVLPINQGTLRAVVAGKTIYETVSLSGHALRIYSTPILYEGEIIGLLQVAGSLEPLQETLRNLRLILLFLSLATLLIVGTTAWTLARKVLEPIGKVIRTASEIQEGEDLRRRIDYNGPPDEIGRLIEQTNLMLGRLEEAYGELDHSYQMQKRFVSDASHELRTPLTAIKGNLDFLQRALKDHPEMAEEVLAEMRQDVDRMMRLIQNLLSLARADAGYQMKMENLQVGEWMEGLLPQLQRFRKEKVVFRIDGLDGVEHLTVHGNRDYLNQLFIILVENAMKYTEEGEVRLTFAWDKKGNSGVSLIAKVTDTGIGIPKEDLPHLFRRFYRGKNALTVGGTGLGLPIAQWIVERHQGELQLMSKEGVGTEVTVQLPARIIA